MRHVRFAPGFRVEQPLQLAFSNVDRSSASDERVDDLLSAASTHLASDTVRALYFANEALTVADSLDRPKLQLAAIRIIIDALKSSNRTADATPYIGRAIELAQTVDDRSTIESLVDMLGQWAIDMEHEQDTPRTSGRRQTPPLGWLMATIARLERDRIPLAEPRTLVIAPASLDERRSNLEIDDSETGLLNHRGLTAELLRLDELRSGFALMQISIVPPAHPIANIARRTVELIGLRGTVARNGQGLLTALLPDMTGIAAMVLAEQLRTALGRLDDARAVSIGIGVAIKQPAESSRDVLRRVTDRAEEAAYEHGVSVVG